MKTIVATTVVATVLAICVALVGLGRIAARIPAKGDAYEVYSFLLRHERSNYFIHRGVRGDGYVGKDLTIIQEETVSWPFPASGLTAEEASQFKDAVA
jgi:hypothetical protein